MPCWTTRPWPHNLNQMVSGNPGTVQCVPDPRIHIEPDKPAKQQIAIHLLHQLPLSPDRKERLKQSRLEHLLWRNRRPSRSQIQFAKSARKLALHLFHQTTEHA